LMKQHLTKCKLTKWQVDETALHQTRIANHVSVDTSQIQWP
jgi:hypothetical protein